MFTAAELAGFCAAHAIWSVSNGEILTPLLAYTTLSNERRMERIINSDPAQAIASGRQRLESNKMDAMDAVLLYDGRISFEQEKSDAIIIEIRAYVSPDSEAVIAIPYTPKQTGEFLVHKPKLLDWKNCEEFNLQTVLKIFFEGINDHKEGSAVWNAHLDESK
jgi:hypothetical protein